MNSATCIIGSLFLSLLGTRTRKSKITDTSLHKSCLQEDEVQQAIHTNAPTSSLGDHTTEKKVAVLGAAEIKCQEEISEKRLEELVFDVTSRVLQECAIEREQIDSVVIAGSDQIDGRAISSMLTACPAGGYFKDEIKVGDDGIFGLILAVMRIMTGVYENSLVVGWSKSSEGDLARVMQLAFDPFYCRPILNYLAAAGLSASAYMKKFHPSESVPAEIVVKNRRQGVLNELAHLRSEVSLKDVLNSPVLSWPIRLLEFAPISDGACAMILGSEPFCRGQAYPEVWIDGMGWATEGAPLTSRELHRMSSLAKAAAMAYSWADIKDPLHQIDVAEVHDISAYHELMEYEALGLCDEGMAPNLISDGVTKSTGALPVNMSGGVLSSNPFACAGLYRAAEIYFQLAGKSGNRQVPDPAIGLAHGISGRACDSNAVVIMKRK